MAETAAETQMAAALATLVNCRFPRSRGNETRMDVYLSLNELLRLEDTEASVMQLRAHVPALLAEFRYDLQHATLADLLHICLRTLSYFMHHRSLAAVFPDPQISVFLGEIVRRLFSTQDQATYKLSLWCLTMQNFEAKRHQFLPRTVEGLVQAVVNPFKSRAIELQALKGLHLLLLKYPKQLAQNSAVLSIWMRPIVSRLASSESATRTQTRLILQEASRHWPKWSEETLQMVQDCIVQYALPVIKTHMDHERQKDALQLWQLTLVLLKTQLAADLAMLNQLMYIPEHCMRHGDATIRLMSMQAWVAVVDVFHYSKEWLFKKPVVHLLVWPILVCLEDEQVLNVVEAAFVSWRRIVSVAVQDFNAFCAAEGHSIESGQPNARKWKRWFDEMVVKPVLTLFKVRLVGREDGNGEEAPSHEIEQFIGFAKRIWEPKVGENDEGKRSESSRSEESCIMAAGESSVMKHGAVDALISAPNSNQKVLDVDDTLLESVGDLPSLCVAADGDDGSARIGSDLIGIAFLLPDVFGAVEKLVTIADESTVERQKQLANELAMATWRGLCARILPREWLRNADKSPPKLRLRLLRLCVDFAFGIATSHSTHTDPRPTDPEPMAEQPLVEQGETGTALSMRFELLWQLQLLAPLVSELASSGDLATVVLHPKSKLLDHIVKRMDCLKKTHPRCAAVLKKCEEMSARDLQVDFSVKANVLPCVVVTLLLEYAVCMDAMEGGHKIEKGVGFESLRLILGGLVEYMKTSETRLSRGVEAVIRFTEDAVRSMNDEAELSGDVLDMLLRVCGKPSKRSCESQQNASLLLGLHEARQKIGVAVPATASTPSSASPNDTLDLEDDTPVRVVQGGASMASDASAGSTCLLSGEVATKARSRPVEACPSTPVNDQQVRPPDETQHNSPRVRAIADEAPVTPRKAMTVEKLKDVERAGKKVPPPMGSMSAPPKLTARSPSTQPRINLGSGSAQCICPDLIGCTDGIALLYRHFPMGFRPFFSFYKVKTIGDLSALSVEKVRTFGLKDPVVTVRRALEEFSGRKNRMKSLLTSPFRQRAQQPPRTSSASSTPSITSPSPSSLSKRPLHREQHGNERLQHKRTRRSLVLDAGEGDHEETSEAVHRQPKLADRVTFCLPSGDAGETRITRPGEDSQDQQKAAAESERESVQEKMSTFTIKLLQHLRRSTYYMDKLVTEEENLHSEEASLQTRVTEVGGVTPNYQEAHELVARLTAQLQAAVEMSSKQYHKLLDKRDEPAAGGSK